MKLIITENQMKILLKEISLNDITSKITEILNNSKEKLEKLKTNVIEIFKESKIDIENHFKILLTFGAGVGGFIGPVEQFVKGEFPTLNEEQISLILLSVITTLFFEGKKTIKNEIKKKIEEKGLTQELETTLSKSEKLKDTFKMFIQSIMGTTVSILNMLSYIFIIPLLEQIYFLIRRGEQIESVEDLTRRLATFATMTLSAKILEKMFKGIINRFKK